MSKRTTNLGFLPCLVCGVDSGPVLNFFIMVVGGGLIASLLILFWALSKGKLQKDNLDLKPLEAEEGKYD